MAIFEVHGGKQLKGDLKPQGAKNEALQVICACLLTEQKVYIDNIPDIRDVNILIDILKSLGVEVVKTKEYEYCFDASKIHIDYLRTEDFRKKAASLRGSIMIIGPLLARFGVGYMPKPEAI